MLWIIAFMLALGFLFAYWGWRWDTKRQRPPSQGNPMVSVIIPSYNSPHLEETVQSAKGLDYQNKEIIVVDDSPHELPKMEGVRLIKNKERIGKANALNLAVSRAKGSILYFLDSDTVTSSDALKKMVPWFTPGVAAVSPKFIAKNKGSFLTRLISLEHHFISSLFKIHMYFGSLISFRGCGVAIKKDTLEKLGGWRETLIEDTDLGSTMVKNGYKIMYEPEAVIRTREPETWSEFKKQRFRWGKGTGFSFFKHWRTYMKNPQFGLYIFPYLLLCLAVSGVFLYQTTIHLLPIASLYLIYTLSIKEFLALFMLFVIPLMGNLATSTTVASISHFAIVTSTEKRSVKELLLIIPYVFVYFPATMGIYLKGMLSAVADKRKGKSEVDFKDW